MAASWQNHVHLMTSAPDPAETTNEWTVMAPNLKPTGMPEHYVIAAPRRAINGTLRAHVLQSGGVPVLFTDYTPRIKVDSMTNLDTLSALLGKTVYYVPAYHDPAAHGSYDVQVLVEKMTTPEAPGPLVPVLYVMVHLTDAD